jgi:hypothetical protein
MNKLLITKLPKFNTIVIRQKGGKFFLSAQDCIIIDIPGLSFILKYLVMNDIMNVKVLEGIIDEYRNTGY